VASALAIVGMATALLLGAVLSPAASAAQPPVGLGTDVPFAVLAGSTVTNTGSSTIAGDVGVSPGSAIVGFPPGLVTAGTQHAADAVALQAQTDLTTAYNDAAGRTPFSVVSSDLGGQILDAGVYQASSADPGLGLTGTVTLDGQNNPDAVFVLQARSTLITASNSTVALIDGAQSCNVFWQVGSSATLGTDSTFVGTIMALTSATLDTGASVEGRVLARNGAVTLDDNVITESGCAATIATTTTTTPAASPTTTTTSATTSVTAAASTGGSGGSAGTGGSSGTGGSGGTSTFSPAAASIVPSGAPQTGAGGASPAGPNATLLAVGSLALVGAGAAVTQAIRRRRQLIARSGPGDAGQDR
jgi:hypothetical protein